ncbi:adenylate/guanylate cyclase domain-containing protein [Geminicoccus roseus]|uniref:adenylate/guanylate cyclase domain-containing protein n=1 Tax=Geminicoccus roseus TaxID=404900 RepID=UPI000419B2D9|nr:tetratricopeptide repeat protein [Geminicoccus roseus]
MGRDETGTFRALKRSFALFQEAVDRAGGRIVNLAADSILAEFPDCQQAALCAIEIQSELAADDDKTLRYRIGLNRGTVLVDGDGIWGDAVNVTARIQEQAAPGAIFASEQFVEKLSPIDGLECEDKGEVRVKNVSRPIRLWRLRRQDEPADAGTVFTRIHLPGIPSIVVLPFGLRGEPGQYAYLAEGMTEDVITDLSRFRELFVIGRTTSFALPSRGGNFQQIGRALGVRYILEGVVMIQGDRFRMNANLVEADTGFVAWSDRYHRGFAELAEVQDDLTRQIVSHLVGGLVRHEERKALGRGTSNLEAYHLVLRGRYLLNRYDREANQQARDLFQQAIDLDRNFARAWANLSRAYNHEWRYRWSETPERSMDLAQICAEHAIGLDPSDARAYGELGWVQLYRADRERALATYETALRHNPNDSEILSQLAIVHSYAGRPREAEALLERAIQLEPDTPDILFWRLGDVYFQMSDYRRVTEVIQKMRDPGEGARLLASAYAHLDMMDEAHRWRDEVLRRQPGFTVSNWMSTQPDASDDDKERFSSGMLKAGLPA